MNENPIIQDINEPRIKLELKNNKLVNITVATIYELLRDIKDPEHPNTLEDLGIINKSGIKIGVIESSNIGEIESSVEKQDFLSNNDKNEMFLFKKGVSITDYGLPINYIDISFVPTIPHCSMAALIGLSIKRQLMKFVDEKYWIRVYIAAETHVNELALNKQLNDKDRVMAAFENEAIVDLIDLCLP
ncbi:hypothetical protein CWI37_0324p0020 [Hamiltosporidium tvaerminnensis]|uniref:MIP18 family-like domain-containing protein n=1 Tax=Hamiltosporidium tvaerminnensis TaxID=1176355 RepID=A0A4Q9L7G7_9MICR|nr:hypothetical protein CWI37_0324p0020 [Hamiltosporidium tvaerminnensis]